MAVHEDATVGFGRGAEGYERGRPSYPDGVVETLVDELAVGPGRTVVDLAAGTGKLTRLLLAAGARVVAVEPVEGMRAVLHDRVEEAEVVAGTAEQLPVRPATVDTVTVAQAFHWFDAARALDEVARVLRPGGGLAMVWNTRDESVPWVAEIGAAIDWQTCKPYDTDTDWAAVVAASGRYTPLRKRTLAHGQELDADTLLTRMLSTSYIAARPEAEQAEVAERLRRIVEGFPATFTLPYLTHVYWATLT